MLFRSRYQDSRLIQYISFSNQPYSIEVIDVAWHALPLQTSNKVEEGPNSNYSQTPESHLHYENQIPSMPIRFPLTFPT